MLQITAGCYKVSQCHIFVLSLDGYECVAFNHEAELTGKKIQVLSAPQNVMVV